MSKRQIVNIIILAILVFGALILVNIPKVSIAIIVVVIALAVGMFRKQIYQLL